ncbi:MAG: flagellar basal-body rod protein FlgF [Syntrophales bacterium]
MGSALYTGISGLNASSTEMDVISNNIANVNTVGYKSQNTYFADILSQSLSGGYSGTMQVGRGVEVADIGTQFGPGSFETTGNATDVAIDGDGFFMVNDKNGATYYTRAGSFHLDNTGNLVDLNGDKVQGYNLLGAAPTTVTDINLNNVQSVPVSTTTFSVGANLDAGTAIGNTFSTTQTVYDSLGDKHSLDITYTSAAPAVGSTSAWDLTLTLDGAIAGTPTTATLEFDANGALINPADNSINFGATLPSGATIGAGGVLTWDMTSSSSLILTGYASTSVINSLTNDGYASGQLKSLSVTDDGKISGFFTNGQTANVAQIVLANFGDPEGLKRMGSNLFGATVTSGPAIMNVPGASGMGTVAANSLEMSNTDIATEFINMITAQKAYSANARIITTEDQMLTELINIKR